MRGDEPGSIENGLDVTPDFSESRFVLHFLPSDPMHVRKLEELPWRADETCHGTHDPLPLNPHYSDGAGAVAALVCGLEVDGNEDRTLHIGLVCRTPSPPREGGSWFQLGDVSAWHELIDMSCPKTGYKWRTDTPHRNAEKGYKEMAPPCQQVNLRSTSSWTSTNADVPRCRTASLCRLHHGAFDASLLGIRPDGQVVISDALLEANDGPTHEHRLKGFDGQRIHVPRRKVLRPRPEYLEERFAAFRATR